MHHSLQIYLQLVSCCELHIYMIKSQPYPGDEYSPSHPRSHVKGWGVVFHPLSPMSGGDGDEYLHPGRGLGPEIPTPESTWDQRYDPLPPREQNDWRTPVKTLPSRHKFEQISYFLLPHPTQFLDPLDQCKEKLAVWLMCADNPKRYVRKT